MNTLSRRAHLRTPVSFLCLAIILAMSPFSTQVRASPAIDAGQGENKMITGDITATAMDSSALNVHDGGMITGQDVTLSSRFDALIRASGQGRITLDRVTLGPSFGALAYIEDGATAMLSNATFTSGDVLYVNGAGSQLVLKDSASSQHNTAFDISKSASLRLDNVLLESQSSGSGAALIRATENATVSLTGSDLTSHDNAVLRLSDGASAVLQDSQLSAFPLHPENIGHYPVIQLNQGTSLDAENVDLSFTAEGSALSLDDNTTVNINRSRITGLQIQDSGAAVNAFGVNSRTSLTDTDILVSGDMSVAPGNFKGAYVGRGASLFMQGGSITTQGNGLTGLRADGATVHLMDTDILTQQSGSAGMVINGASGEMTGGAIVTQDRNSPALVLQEQGHFTVSGTRIQAQASEALQISGGPAAPLTLTLDNAQVNGGAGTALVMQDAGKPQTSGAVISTGLRNGTLMSGDIDVTGNDMRSVFGVDIDSATLTGAVKAEGGHTSLTTTNDGVWNVTGNSMLDSLHNAGTVHFTGDAPGITLHIRGDYTGNNGLMVFRTVLGDDHSVTDHVTIEGATKGTTRVAVTNAGGSGARTLEGIELIHVGGESVGEFQQQGRIAAGAYDYNLMRGNGEHAANWYLTSKAHALTPEPSPMPGPDPTPIPDMNSSIRPEAGTYSSNLAAANTLFINRLHDRLGETQYINTLTNEKKVTSIWLRQAGGHNAWRDSTGQLKTRSNRYVMQIGGDIARWSGSGSDRWHLGMMAGYGHSSSNTRSSSTGYRSDGTVNGYSTGLYATWYASDDTHLGAYLDSWVQYGRFNNRVKGQDIQGESYKSKGITGSLESGYTHKVGEFTGSKGTLNEWYIQPQAQAVWMGVKADDHREANGTLISGEGDGNVQTRLGVRTFLKSHSAIDNGKDREFQPFVEVNWIHNTRDFGTKMDGVSIRQSGARNLGEIKTGVEGQLNPALNVWGNIGVQMGNNGYNDTSAMAGIKYSFK